MLDKKITEKIAKEIRTILKSTVEEKAVAVATVTLGLIVQTRLENAGQTSKDASFHISGFVSNLIFFNSNPKNLDQIRSLDSASKGIYIASMALGKQDMPDIRLIYLEYLEEQYVNKAQELNQGSNQEVELHEYLDVMWEQCADKISNQEIIHALYTLSQFELQAVKTLNLIYNKKKRDKQTSLFYFVINKLRKLRFGLSPLKLITAVSAMIFASSVIPPTFVLDIAVLFLTGLGGLQVSDQLEQLSDNHKKTKIETFVKSALKQFDFEKGLELSKTIANNRMQEQQESKKIDFGDLFDKFKKSMPKDTLPKPSVTSPKLSPPKSADLKSVQVDKMLPNVSKPKTNSKSDAD